VAQNGPPIPEIALAPLPSRKSPRGCVLAKNHTLFSFIDAKYFGFAYNLNSFNDYSRKAN
jgi:hypothetical protein